MDAARRRDDEFAEVELRILIALYDAWPDARDVRLGEAYRPGGRYTGPSDAPAVIQGLLAGRIAGRLTPVGLIGARLRPDAKRRLDEVDEGGVPWIARARAVIAEASSPRLGHAAEVRDGLWA